MKNRSLFAAALLLIVSAFVAAGVGRGTARAQETVTLTAAVVSGSCDDPGESAGELRDLGVAEGGVLTSFSRIDIPIADLTGGDYAIAVAIDGNTVACGDATGEGDNVYVAIKSTSDDGYGGIAWLTARDSQTQVSLFMSQGLGGAALGNIDNPEPPAEETPEPPAEETPESTPKPAKTPKASKTQTPEAELTTYESPTWGYTMSYDATVWEEKANETNATSNGAQDFLNLSNGTSTVLLYSNAADVNMDVTIVGDIMAERLAGQEGVSNVEVATDADGNELRGGDASNAWIQINFTWTNSSGKEFNYYDYYVFQPVPDQPAVAIFLFEGFEETLDQQAPDRDALIETIEMP